jgi:hypothetical protein
VGKIEYVSMNGRIEKFNAEHYAYCEEMIMPLEDGPVCRVYLTQGPCFLARAAATWIRQQVINWREISDGHTDSAGA